MKSRSKRNKGLFQGTAGSRGVFTAVLRVGMFVWLILETLHAAPANAAATHRAVVVHGDGTIACPTNGVTPRLGGSALARSVTFGFGLPDKPVERGWLEDDGVPVCQTIWEKDGIRYTQKVLVTSLGTDDLTTLQPADPGAVILVQIAGHNTASEYTTARALLEIRIDGRPLDLELRSGMVFVAGSKESAPLAMVEIPGEGIASTNGVQLRFQGSMPPATSGTMTLKIPTARLNAPAMNRLMDLGFDDELTRVKRAWKKPAGTQPRVASILLAEPLK